MPEGEDRALMDAARAVLENAYVPYSTFPVGAAVLATDGRIFAGTNVENASLGLTMCAERVALFTAVAAGAKDFCAMAITASKLKPIVPCGACRQVMAEHLLPDARIYLDSGSEAEKWSIQELLPAAFAGSALKARG